MITEKQLSHILYCVDPEHTSCNVNSGMTDEYDTEANHIVHLLSLGVPFKTALHDVFSFFFCDGCLINTIESIIIEIEYYNHISKYEI